MSDLRQRCLFDAPSVRGTVVQLDASWRAVLERRDYPAPVRAVLGELLAAAALLASTIKFRGLLTLQLQAAGPLRIVTAQCTHDGALRGLARYDEGVEAGDTLDALCGSGSLVISIQNQGASQPYQGVVSIEGQTVAGALETYFRQSEQLATRLWFAADTHRAAGLLLQRLPGEAADADGWDRLVQLAATVTDEELRALPPETLLYRLFHEEDRRGFDAEPLHFRCNCSHERVAGMLRGLGLEEVQALLAEQGEVRIDCEFCGHHYRFDRVDAEAVFAAHGQPQVATTRH